MVAFCKKSWLFWGTLSRIMVVLCYLLGFLTYVGCLTYIHFLLFALPTVFACMFKLQKTLIIRLDKSWRLCLWRKDDLNRHPNSIVAWYMVFHPKAKGGLGIIDLELQNEALLLKQLFHLFNKVEWSINHGMKTFVHGRIGSYAHEESGSQTRLTKLL